MKNYKLCFIIFFLLSTLFVSCQEKETDVEEENAIELNKIDMLTPAYYKPDTDTLFIHEVNEFLSFVQQDVFHHPLANEHQYTPEFTVPPMGKFGAGKGPSGTEQHHPAVDLHVSNNKTDVTIYAAHDGKVATFKDADKYRQYISITKEILNDDDINIGKLNETAWRR